VIAGALGPPLRAPHLGVMRSVVALALTLAASGAALAYCPDIPDTAATHYVENKTTLALCRQNELAFATRLHQQQLDLQAALQAQQQNLQVQSRLQQTYDAARQVTLPQF
jgi:hypothetical protein